MPDENTLPEKAAPAPKKKRGRPKLYDDSAITETMQKRVESMAGLGHTEVEIALVMGVDVKTFRKHFLRAYQTGKVKAVYNVASVLYEQAVKERDGDAVRYFLSHRAEQWKDKQNVELSGNLTVDSPLSSLLGRIDRLKKRDNGDKGSLASDGAGEPDA